MYTSLFLFILQGIHALSFILRWNAVGFFDTLLLLFFLFINGLIYSQFSKYSKPTFEGDELVNAGVPLDSAGKFCACNTFFFPLKRAGLIEYLWDILYLTWFVMLLCLYSYWGLLVYLLVCTHAGEPNPRRFPVMLSMPFYPCHVNKKMKK